MKTTGSLLLALASAIALASGCTVITAAVTDDVIDCDQKEDGTVCGNEYDDHIDRICVASACVEKGCGDGYVDTATGEVCDDGNDVMGDGCEPEICTLSCMADVDCDDGSPCNGTESCDQASHACTNPADVVCTPSDACHTSTCSDGASGVCVEELIDGDMDGFAPSALGVCGTDCNDANAQQNPDVPDICGDNIDNDCNPNTSDNTQTQWWADCDGDGYALNGAKTVTDCNKPATTLMSTSCPMSSPDPDWTYRNPNVSATIDCYDQVPLAYPGATAWHTDQIPGTSSYNWNCLNGTEYRYGSGTYLCTPNYFCFKFTCCYSSTAYYGWVDGTAPGCSVAETMERCGTDMSSGGYCGNDVSVTQSCR